MSDTRPDLDALIVQEVAAAIFETRDDDSDLREWGDEVDGEERERYECDARAALTILGPAIAAERERAAGLAAIIEQAREHVATMADGDDYPLEAMWRSEIMRRLTTTPPDALAAHDAEVWERGRRAGGSVAMRRMSDEPGAPDAVNPYRTTS